MEPLTTEKVETILETTATKSSMVSITTSEPIKSTVLRTTQEENTDAPEDSPTVPTSTEDTTSQPLKESMIQIYDLK